MNATEDGDQPLGEGPELDLSYTHRDGRHVPVTLRAPSWDDAQEWWRCQEEMGKRIAGRLDMQYVVAAQDHARQAFADIDQLARAEAASFTEALLRRSRPRIRDHVILALSLWALIAVTAYVIAHAGGVL